MKNIFVLVIFVLLCSAEMRGQWWGPWEVSDGLCDLAESMRSTNFITIKDSNIYIIASGKILYSKDNGKNWVTCKSNFAPRILTLATKDNYLFAGTDWGILISTNNGTTWKLNKIAGLRIPIICLSIIGDDLIAGTDYKGIYISRDNGENWTAINNGLPDSITVQTIAIKDSNIFIGTYENGIFQSTDYGNRWIEKNNGIQNFNIISIAINSDYIYTATNGSGIYLSTDDGKHWNQKNNGLENLYVTSFNINGDNLLATCAGNVFFSQDNGNSWSKIYKSTDYKSESIMITSYGNDLYNLTFGSGILHSTDKGKTWSPIICCMRNFETSVISTNSNKIFAGSVKNGIFTSIDNGTTWHASNTVLADGRISTISGKGDTIIAGTSYSGIFLSTDNGNNWELKNNGLPDSTIITSFVFTDNDILAGTSSGLFHSTDIGNRWSLRSLEFKELYISSMVICGNDIIVGTISHGVYVSTDKGNTWTTRNNGLPDSIKVRTIAISNKDIYLCTENGVYLSTDSGSKWTEKKTFLGDTNIVQIKVFGSFVFLAVQQYGLYLSADKCDNWKYIGFGMFDMGFTTITSMSIFNDYLFVGTYSYSFGDRYNDIYRAKLSSLGVSVEDNSNIANNDFTIHPNPANDFIEISAVENGPSPVQETIGIYNVLGKCVKKPNPSFPQGSGVRIDVSDLAPGLYYCMLSAGGNRITKNFVVVK